MRRQRVVGGLVGLALAAGVLAAVVVFIIPTNAQREGRPQFGPDESRPIDDIYLGKTQEELIALLGPPTREGPWYIGLPPVEYRENHKGAQTLEWHWGSGQFLASVHPTDGKWVCYSCCWLPKGCIVD